MTNEGMSKATGKTFVTTPCKYEGNLFELYKYAQSRKKMADKSIGIRVRNFNCFFHLFNRWWIPSSVHIPCVALPLSTLCLGSSNDF